MSGRGGRGSGRGGRGNNGGRSSGRGRGHNYNGASNKTSKNGLCTTLGTHIFDFGHKAAADQMRTTWEKLVQYVGTTYGQDISNELQNKTTVTLLEPEHSPAVMARHAIRERMIHVGQANLQQAREAQRVILEAAVAANNLDAPMKLAILNNEIAQGDFEQNEEVPIVTSESEKTQYSND